MIEKELNGDILTLRLAHGKASALDLELCQALTAALHDATAADARVVILTGTGSIFSAGVDLFRLTSEGPDYVSRFFPAMRDTFMTLFTFAKPLVAAMNGHAIAGGCLMGAACDYRVMSAGRIGTPELLVGVPLPAVAMEILRFATGRDAHWLTYSGRTVPAEDAVALGLIDEFASAQQLMTRANLIAQQLASIDSEVFSLTKSQLRSDALRRMSRMESLDERAAEIWARPATHNRIKEYLARTVSKK